MGRFIKELRYSMKLRRHLFFLMLVWFVAMAALWLFQGTVLQELKSSFPSDYGKASTTKKEFKVAGYYDDMAAVNDADLKAEILMNQALHNADWMSYREIAVQNLHVRAYMGTEQAIVGFGTDAFAANKEVDIEGSTYSKVNAIWMDETAVKEAALGMIAERLFVYPNDYTDKMFVVLGAGFEADYKAGDVMKVHTGYGELEAHVKGFLSKGASAELEGKNVTLDYYIVCPLDNMDTLYGGKEKPLPTEESAVYISNALLTADSAFCDTTLSVPVMVEDEKEFRGVKSIWLSRALMDDAETAPEWLQKLIQNEQNPNFSCVVLGSNYIAKNMYRPGSVVEAISGDGKLSYTCTGTLEAGTTYMVNGKEIVLDDYLVFFQPDYEEMYAEEAPGAPNGTTTPDSGETDGEDANLPEAPAPEPEPEEPQKNYSVAERTKLFSILFLKNRGYFETTLTANESQRELAKYVEASWKNFYLENKNIDAITTYTVREADATDSILYRANVQDKQEQMKQISKIGYLVGMVLLALYFFFKLRRGVEYYTAIVMTGTSTVEVMLLFLLEGIILFALATGMGFVVSFVICKLLQLNMIGIAGIIKWNIIAIGIPTIANAVRILLRDFGKMFRRV